MLVIALLVLVFATIFMLGVLVIGVTVSMRHGDPSASYKLYAVRDKLVDAVIFRGVPRDDPWFDALYENVNSILMHSKLLSGPKRWPLAVAVGEYQAKYPKSGKPLRPLPEDGECPEAVKEIGCELREALKYLTRNHTGIVLQLNARKREEMRIQKDKAQRFLNMIGPRGGGSQATA